MIRDGLPMAWARLFVRSLTKCGVRDVVLSPGSRSSLLALAALEEEAAGRLRLHVVIDERSAAFFALGQARMTGMPSVLVCTSGTAAAHYFPALVEASLAHVPLLAVTADRPWEAQGVGALQTIDQTKLFGGYVRHFAELGLPEASALSAVPRVAAQSVHASVSPVPGPVHVNARFRKPLEPLRGAPVEEWNELWESLEDKGPPLVARSLPAGTRGITAARDMVTKAKRGLIVAGPRSLAAATTSLHVLAERLGFPLLAEATSQARFGESSAGTVVSGSFNLLFRTGAFASALAPDLIVEIGASPTSSAYSSFLTTYRGSRLVVGGDGWSDPSGTADLMSFCDPRDLVVERPKDARYLEAVRLLVAAAGKAVRAESSVFGEGDVARTLVAALPNDAVLMVGNGTPIRDLDLYAETERRVRVLHQRGASGIDGLVAGAAGAKSVTSDPCVLFLGDVSLVHDVGSLSLVKDEPVVIVTVANGGGRIFDELPLATAIDEKAYERLFLTPPSFDALRVAAAFGIEAVRVRSEVELASALRAALDGCSRGKGTVIEAVVPPGEGAKRRARIVSAMSDALPATLAAAPRPPSDVEPGGQTT